MAINSSTTLNGSTLANLLALAIPLGVQTSAGKVKDLVSGVERAVTFFGSAAFASDADGDYINCAAGTDWASIAETFDPSSPFTSIYVWTPTTINPPAWSGIYSLRRNVDGPLCQLGRQASDNDLRGQHDSTQASIFTNGISYLTANVYSCLVVTFNGTTTAKVFATGQASPISASNTASQTAGAATNLYVGNVDTQDGVWTQKARFFGYINSALSDANAQAIANDPEGELFDAVGGGGFQAAWAKGSNVLTGGAVR